MGCTIELPCTCGGLHLVFLADASMADHLHYGYEYTCPKNGTVRRVDVEKDGWWKSEVVRPKNSVVIRQIPKEQAH